MLDTASENDRPMSLETAELAWASGAATELATAGAADVIVVAVAAAVPAGVVSVAVAPVDVAVVAAGVDEAVVGVGVGVDAVACTPGVGMPSSARASSVDVDAVGSQAVAALITSVDVVNAIVPIDSV